MKILTNIREEWHVNLNNIDLWFSISVLHPLQGHLEMCGDIAGYHNDWGMLWAFAGQGPEAIHWTLIKSDTMRNYPTLNANGLPLQKYCHE